MTEVNFDSSAPGRDGLHLAALMRGSAKIAVLAINAAGRIMHADEQFEQWTGLTAASVLQKDISVLPAALRGTIESLTAQPNPVAPLDVTLGPNRRVRLEKRQLPLGGTEPLTLILLHDGGSLKQLEARVEQLDRLGTVGALSATIGHELRNRLVALRTFAEKLLEQFPQDEFAGLTRRELLRMDSVLGWLLDFSRQQQVHFEELRVHDVLAELLHLVHAGCEDRKIHIQMVFKAARDVVQADEVQLQQALLNLLFNAMDAMPDGGTLTVFTEAAADEVVIRISDTGAGIAPEVRARLFEPFFTTKPGGTGIGLPICNEIVRGLGGHIEVKSEPGKGSEFSVHLPAAK